MAKNPRLQVAQPIVNEDGTMSPPFVLYTNLLNNLVIPIFGVGSPEGVVEGPQFSHYIDTLGTTGTIDYFKKLEQIGNDKSMGWILR